MLLKNRVKNNLKKWFEKIRKNDMEKII